MIAPPARARVGSADPPGRRIDGEHPDAGQLVEDQLDGGVGADQVRTVVVAGVVEERADNSDAHEVHDSLGELVDVGCVALQQTSELFRAAGSFVHGAPERSWSWSRLAVSAPRVAAVMASMRVISAAVRSAQWMMYRFPPARSEEAPVSDEERIRRRCGGDRRGDQQQLNLGELRCGARSGEAASQALGWIVQFAMAPAGNG